MFKQKGRFLKTAFFALRLGWRPGPTQSAGFAVVAGQKVSRSAVERNRVRRRLRHALRQLAPHCPPGQAVVVMAYSTALKAPFTEVEATLKQALTKVGLIKG